MPWSSAFCSETTAAGSTEQSFAGRRAMHGDGRRNGRRGPGRTRAPRRSKRWAKADRGSLAGRTRRSTRASAGERGSDPRSQPGRRRPLIALRVASRRSSDETRASSLAAHKLRHFSERRREILRASGAADLGIRSSRTPFFSSAATASAFVCAGNRNRQTNGPLGLPRR